MALWIFDLQWTEKKKEKDWIWSRDVSYAAFVISRADNKKEALRIAKNKLAKKRKLSIKKITIRSHGEKIENGIWDERELW